MLKAVFFDAAGTLFRVRGSVGVAYATIAAGHGVVADAEHIEQRFRAAFRGMPPLCFPGIPDAELSQHEQSWWKDVVAAAFADVRFRDFEAFFIDLFAHFAQADSWELFPDTQPVLSALQARGVRLGVVSNFDGRLPMICNGLGIGSYFETIVMSGRAGCAKPDPRIFAIALGRIGVSAADALHVGDSESADIAGAQAAGLRAILIQRGTPGGGFRPQIHDLREVIARL